jgi:hypothetical protein
MTQKKKRTPASDLVVSCNPERKSWIKYLSKDDYTYVLHVAEEACHNPGIPLACIARALIKELGAKCSEGTVIRALKGIIGE